MPEFEEVLLSALRQQRARLAAAEVPNVRIDIEIYGRVLEGDLNVVFTCGDGYAADNARGGTLDTVVTEFLRRREWGQRHNPLRLSLLSAAEPVELEESARDTNAAVTAT